MKVTTYETLYYEDHGAILKHKCGKRDSSNCPFSLFLSFSLLIRCQLHDHAKSNMTMMKRVIINGTVESCMAIYLRMAMEMP